MLASVGGIGFREVLAILIVPVLVVLPFYKIFSKAGYPGILAVTVFIPVVNFVMVLFSAFSDWPVLKELRYLRDRSSRP